MPAKKNLTPAQKEKLFADYYAGRRTVAEIAHDHGVSKRAVYNWIKGKTRRSRPKARRSFPVNRDEVDLLRYAIASCTEKADAETRKRLSFMDEALFQMACDMDREAHGEL